MVVRGTVVIGQFNPSGMASVGLSGAASPAVPRIGAPARRERPLRRRRAISLPRLPFDLSVALGACLVVLGCAAALLTANLAFVTLTGIDEPTMVETELRERGLVVMAVERLAAGTYPGNDGVPVAVPEGAHLYRVTYRSGEGTTKEAYRLIAGWLDRRWSFPEVG